MSAESDKTRQQAINELSRFGITGEMIYLIDIIPLIEMIWADGKVQDDEVAILEEYLPQHVNHINEIAGGPVLTMQTARKFVSAFLKKRPDPTLLQTLRSFIAPIRFSSTDTTIREAVRKSLLSACIDIAASAVSDHPHGLHDRFNLAEKKCFFEILESL